MSNYELIIGLEVHVELSTKSKMFCRCDADYFGKKPNTQTCPVCLGLPGALPYINEQAIKDCIKIGLALNCEISKDSRFERKNYFYPDLPKGYQISQYRWPLCIKGWIEVVGKNGATSKIRINRVHQEEDTAKLVHQLGISNFKFPISNEQKLTLIDFNRSGVPLVEIVSEPDFRDVEEVRDYAKKLQQIFRYLGVSNADMERGDMRLEANISLREIQNSKSEIRNDELPNYRVELKNINSFRFMIAAIEFEIKRQTEELESGRILKQETRGWDENSKKTYLQRSKEEAHDYRYFPDPDLPPILLEEFQISNIKSQIPELPEKKLERFKSEYKLSSYDVEIITREREMADYYEEGVKIGKEFEVTPKQIVDYIINKKVNIDEVLPAKLVQAIKSALQVVAIDMGELERIINQVIEENQKAVGDYKAGKEAAIMFLVGQVMRRFKEKTDAKIVKEKIEEQIR
ncbi:Asp-tRNA(Asn)/Glu-tRNA(Gln) amidotransferase subunit GatB [Candidatus Parcubacteria bacterium]|nr:MAG: Asp-tRNA(Asn)/Glu-tRNA(Gln) amidotransferase subunit GatB [Candidatus Parcubacteria bacterium]